MESRCRSPRLDHQIPEIEEGAGVTPRRNPQIYTSEDGAGVTRRRRGTSSEVSASLPDDDDMLREILLRLPPQPSSLPRANAVCKRWRDLVTDPKFVCSFRAHHRKPPLLGIIQHSREGIVFTPALDPPDRIPPVRLSLGHYRCGDYRLVDCRHGLLLLRDIVSCEVGVCAPITGEQRRVALPPEFKRGYFNGALICAAGNQGGGCLSSPFKVVLMGMYNRPTVCVYSSENGIWGDLISTEAPYQLGRDTGIPATMVGNALYWLSRNGGILEFDLDRQSLAVITKTPTVTNDAHHVRYLSHRIIRAEDGALGFAEFSFPHFIMWRRNVDGQGVPKWVPWKTIEMHKILGLPSQIVAGWKCRVGYGEDADVVFLHLGYKVYMVELESMQYRKIYEAKHFNLCHSFTSFYTPGTAINGGCNGPELLHDT